VREREGDREREKERGGREREGERERERERESERAREKERERATERVRHSLESLHLSGSSGRSATEMKCVLLPECPNYQREHRSLRAASAWPALTCFGDVIIGSRNRCHLRFVWGVEPFWFQSVHLNVCVPQIVQMDR
jgi:hypothetical protein